MANEIGLLFSLLIYSQQCMETNLSPISEELNQRDKKQIYTVEGRSVTVGSRQFTPERAEQTSKDNAIIYLPGWSITEKAKSVQALCQTFADTSGNTTFAVDTRMDKVSDASLSQQAEGVRQFIQEQGLRNITVVGNSMDFSNKQI